MAQQRHLSRAPITEALISFQLAQVPTGFDEKADRLLSELTPSYYRKGEITSGTLRFDMGSSASGNVQTESRRVGMRIHSTDEKYVLQLVHNAFTLSRLEPYQTWVSLHAEMRRLWQAYVNIFGPQAVSRTAVRYINRLQLELTPPRQLDETFVNPPKVPEGMPEVVSSFVSRVVVEDSQVNASVAITIASQPPGPDMLPVLLDIEAVRDQTLSATDTHLWESLEVLRNLKNAAFFGSLTERVVRTYE